MSFKATITRLRQDNEVQTLGRFHFYKGLNEVAQFAVLELADKNNERRISRIKAGKYKCRLRWSKKYQWHFILEDVEGRDYILIHFGNYHRDTKGCIILGNNFYDIDKDGYTDVTSSKKTMKRLLAIAPDEFWLTIVDD